jgi:hypothetical protein
VNRWWPFALALSWPSGAAAQTAAPDGYVEANYSYNFNRPSNGITNFRGFDNRHQTFTLSNAVLGVTLEYQSLAGRVSLQIGHTPTTYYLAEPSLRGTNGTAPTGAEIFKFIQEAYVGWKAPVGRGLLLQGGVFLSPIGYEALAIKDSWNWSRSNLFFGLPFYHTGLRATYLATKRLTISFLLVNGWNSVVDGNTWKSIAAQWIYDTGRSSLGVVYFGGPERAKGSAEGQPWRHLVDVWADWDATKWLSLAVQVDAGFERNPLGLAWWAAAAGYVRVQPVSWLYLAARGDFFREHVPADEIGVASPIFWPADWVSSGTLTADFRPHKNVSFRLEYRHDHAAQDMYFKGEVEGDGDTKPFVPNARAQDTATAGVTGWLP